MGEPRGWRQVPDGRERVGLRFGELHLQLDHADVVHARFHPYVSEDMAWTLQWHSIQTEVEQFMDAHDRAKFEKYYEPFVRHDRAFIFHHLPKKRLSDYLPLVNEFFPEKVLF